MSSTPWRNICVAIAVASFASLFCSSQLLATTYTFDLTNQIALPFGASLESTVDLGTTFSQIDSVSINLSGIFSPGLKTFATIPPNASPAVTHDQLFLAVRLGNESTSWIDKETFAGKDLKGLSGQVDFVLPLTAVEPSVPVLFPSGGRPPSYGFLLDGRFGLSTLAADILAANYEELAVPAFATSKISLIVEGTAVPEPTVAVLAMMGIVAVTSCCRHRR